MDACILAYTRLPLQAPRALLGRCAAALPYARRLRLRGSEHVQWQGLAGLGLACWLLRRELGRDVRAAQLRCPRGGAPYLPGGPAFSIAHAGEWVACVLAPSGSVGLDLEPAMARAPFGTLADWVAREAVAKAAGRGLAAVRDIRLEAGEWAGESAVLAGRRWQLLAPRLPLPLVLRVALDAPVQPAPVGVPANTAASAPALRTLRVPFVQVCAALCATGQARSVLAGSALPGSASAAA
jgi:hypothetical protein